MPNIQIQHNPYYQHNYLGNNNDQWTHNNIETSNQQTFRLENTSRQNITRKRLYEDNPKHSSNNDIMKMLIDMKSQINSKYITYYRFIFNLFLIIAQDIEIRMLHNIIIDNISKEEERIIHTDLISTASDLIDYDSKINSVELYKY